MKNCNFESVYSAMERLGFKIFDGTFSNGGYRDYDLNIVGIRSNNSRADFFDDMYVIFFRLDKRWRFFSFEATTDPGASSLKNPIFPEAVARGTLILCHHIQFRSAYKLGWHGVGSWRHTALVQTSPVAGFRDSNRDDILDMNKSTVTWGLWGANHHAASLSTVVDRVGNFSAGCQVIRRPSDYYTAADLWKKAAALWGPFFSYTILLESDLY